MSPDGLLQQRAVGRSIICAVGYTVLGARTQPTVPTVAQVARLIHRRRPAAGGRQTPEAAPKAASYEADTHQQPRSGLWNSTDMEPPASSSSGLHKWHSQLPALSEMPSSLPRWPFPGFRGWHSGDLAVGPGDKAVC